MARERVYAKSDPVYHEQRTSDDPPAVLPGVQVQFHAEGGLVGIATGHLTDATFDEDEAKTRSVAELVAVPYHAWFDRHELNELIRKLRRARNVAFGADE